MAKTPEQMVRAIIKKDKRYKRFDELCATNTDWHIPYDEWRLECRSLHSGRKVKRLKTSSAKFARQLVSAVANETAVRSRLTEMLVQCTTVHAQISRHLDALTDWLTIEYAQEMSRVAKTIKEREAFVNDLMAAHRKQMFEVGNLIEEVKFYIQDIDKTGYAVKAMAEVFTAIYRTEGRVDMG